MKRKLALLLAAVLCLLCGSSLAFPQPGEDFYYLDTTGALSEEAEATIYFCNRLLEEACGAQIVVAVIDSLDGVNIFDYALELFTGWDIGSAEKNNGFLLLVVGDEDYITMHGNGVHDLFTDDIIFDLFRTELEPGFDIKNYEAGALRFFRAVLESYIDHYDLDFRYEDGRSMAIKTLASRKATDNLKENGGQK